MAIPITCPGCQAAFEVPETLAGKTIRCTSCKTQLSVPSADSKKPFGWATGPSAAQTAAAPMALDDAPPLARVSKPAVKAAVVDDDEEDDEKTSPNKPAAKKSGSMIKGAPKKRRDDDDDDDDDQPRKKKKNTNGGSGAVIALIGGGVLCLGAIVGLCIWLLNGDDKKDTAKSDNSNNNTTPTNGSGGMTPPPGNGGQMTPPPTGGSGDGAMTLPGKPGSGGGRPPIPSGSSGAGMTPPSGGSLPPNGGGLTPIRPGVGSSASPPGGFPGGGRPPIPGTGGEAEITQPPTGGVGGIGIPQPPPGIGTGPPPGMGGIQQPPGGFPQPPGGFPQPPGGGIGQPPGPGGGRPPIGGGIGQPPGGIGGQPPGGIGGGIGGGQADPNPAPFGAKTDGDSKAVIDKFFTGAFDSKAKEFFTFSAKATNGKISTKLNRYDVTKSFADQGSFKVLHFVTRVAIDPNKGLLYAATISNPSVQAVGSQQFDQAAGIGDVHIYDLNAIREKKVAPNAELKSLVIGVGRTIRGMELSEDGKSLIVVTTVTSGKTHKSFLTKYDTETRKPVGAPTALPEAAWNMCKSPDGKNLLIIDMVDRPNASMVRFYDIETLFEIKKRSLQGGANDIGATSAGQIAGAVNGATGIKVVLATETGTRDLELGIGWKAANKPGYVKFSPDGKLLFVSGHPGQSGTFATQQWPAGLDVYEVTDAESPTGVKKKASIRTAGGIMVGGHFFVSPDGDFLVFHSGAVIDPANVGGNNGEGTPGGGIGGGGVGGGLGFPGGGVAPMPPGGGIVPPGGLPGGAGPIRPGAGGGGPPGGGVQPKPPGAGGGGPPGGIPGGVGVPSKPGGGGAGGAGPVNPP